MRPRILWMWAFAFAAVLLVLGGGYFVARMIDRHRAEAARRAAPRTIPRIDTSSPPSPFSLPRTGVLTEPEIAEALRSGARLDKPPILMLEKPRDESPAARARSVLEWLSFASEKPRTMNADPNDIRLLAKEAIDQDPGSSVLAMYLLSFAFKEKVEAFDYEIATHWVDRATREGAAASEMLAAAQCIYSIEPFAAVALLERAKGLAPDSGEVADWLEYVGSVAEDRRRPLRTVREASSQLGPVRASLSELGDPNDPSLPARLKSAHSGAKLIELAEQYQQMARVAFDAREFEQCWLGAQISLQLLDSFAKNPDHAPRLAESAASCGRAKLATGNAIEAREWLLKAGGYLALAERALPEVPLKLAAEMIDAKESLAVVEFLLRWRPGLARAAAARPAFLPRTIKDEARVGLWLFLLSHGLPPMIR